MSDKNQETIADIVSEMRALGRLDEKSTDKIPRSLQALGLRTYADRIEAAANREREAGAEKMRENLGEVMHKKYTAKKIREMEAIVASGDIGPMTRKNVALMLKQAAEMRDRLDEAIRRGATREKSSQVGNAAKMREALEQAKRVLHCAIVADILKGEDARKAFNAVTAALSAPPRNCDVGTVDEQIKRHRNFCNSNVCKCEPSCKICFAKWTQRPYEEVK